ncbi:MAG: GNAT family N-acetyltransferase [Trueperaceae bacterium]|nr:GNAT family N-acetyltransferase [Trueperaceae bacterium]
MTARYNVTVPTREHQGATVRVATRADEAAVADVAYRTAYFGGPAAAFFPCRDAFAVFWVLPYLRAGHAMVVETDDGVVGYCVGVDRGADYVRGLLPLLPGLLGELLTGRCRGWRGALRYGLRALRYPTRGAPANAYPAHLHVALTSAARGRGSGRALLTAYLAAAAERGVSGLQLSTTERNAQAVSLYSSLGFEVWTTRVSPLWRPWTGRDETHLVLVKRLTGAKG